MPYQVSHHAHKKAYRPWPKNFLFQFGHDLSEPIHYRAIQTLLKLIHATYPTYCISTMSSTPDSSVASTVTSLTLVCQSIRYTDRGIRLLIMCYVISQFVSDFYVCMWRRSIDDLLSSGLRRRPIDTRLILCYDPIGGRGLPILTNIYLEP